MTSLIVGQEKYKIVGKNLVGQNADRGLQCFPPLSDWAGSKIYEEKKWLKLGKYTAI